MNRLTVVVEVGGLQPATAASIALGWELVSESGAAPIVTLGSSFVNQRLIGVETSCTFTEAVSNRVLPGQVVSFVANNSVPSGGSLAPQPQSVVNCTALAPEIIQYNSCNARGIAQPVVVLGLYAFATLNVVVSGVANASLPTWPQPLTARVYITFIIT